MSPEKSPKNPGKDRETKKGKRERGRSKGITTTKKGKHSITAVAKGSTVRVKITAQNGVETKGAKSKRRVAPKEQSGTPKPVRATKERSDAAKPSDREIPVYAAGQMLAPEEKEVPIYAAGQMLGEQREDTDEELVEDEEREPATESPAGREPLPMSPTPERMRRAQAAEDASRIPTDERVDIRRNGAPKVTDLEENSRGWGIGGADQEALARGVRDQLGTEDAIRAATAAEARAAAEQFREDFEKAAQKGDVLELTNRLPDEAAPRASASAERKQKRQERSKKIYEAYVAEGIMTRKEADEALAQGSSSKKLSVGKQERMQHIRGQVLLKEKDRESLVGLDRVSVLNDRRSKVALEEAKYLRQRGGYGNRLLQFIGLKGRVREHQELLTARREYADVRIGMEERLRDGAEHYYMGSDARKKFESGIEKGSGTAEEKNAAYNKKASEFERRYARLTAAQFNIEEFRKLGLERGAALGANASAAQRLWSWYTKQNRYLKAGAGSLIFAIGSGASFAAGAALAGRALMGAAVGRGFGEAAALGWERWRKHAEKLAADIESLKAKAATTTLEERDAIMKEIDKKERARKATLNLIRAGTTALAAGATAAATAGVVASASNAGAPWPEWSKHWNEGQIPVTPRPDHLPTPEAPAPYPPEPTPTPETPIPGPRGTLQPEQQFPSRPEGAPDLPRVTEIPSPKGVPNEILADPKLGVNINEGSSLWSTLNRVLKIHPDLEHFEPGQKMYIGDGIEKEISRALKQHNFDQLRAWGIDPDKITKGINQGQNIGKLIDYEDLIKKSDLYQKWAANAGKLTPQQIQSLNNVAARQPYLR